MIEDANTTVTALYFLAISGADGALTAGRKCKFVECRLRKTQQTFIVSIPERFTVTDSALKTGTGESSLAQLSQTHLVSADKAIVKRQLTHLLETKGTIRADFISISSGSVCHVFTDPAPGAALGADSFAVECYRVMDQNDTDLAGPVSGTLPPLQKNEVEQFQNRVVRLEQQSGTASSTLGHGPAATATAAMPPKDGIELVFDADPALRNRRSQEASALAAPFNPRRSRNRSPVDLVPTPRKSPATPLEGGGVPALPSPGPGSTVAFRANAVPRSFKNDEIELGLIYVAFDLKTFHKNLAGVGRLLTEKYQLLEDNELDVRQEKIDRVKRDAETLAIRVSEVDEKLMQQEDHIRKKIEILTDLVVRAERVSLHAERSRLAGAAPEINAVHVQIRSAISEENVALLRLKDTAHDALEMCVSLLSEMLDHIAVVTGEERLPPSRGGEVPVSPIRRVEGSLLVARP